MMQEERGQAIAAAKRLMEQDPVVIDTETTGMEQDAEIVELAAVNRAGQPLVNTLVHATRPVKPGARDVHGISDADLQGAPGIHEAIRQLQETAGDRPLAAYNADFDRRMLQSSLRAAAQQGETPHDFPPHIHCVMLLYARFRGNWNSYHRTYTFHGLMRALEYEGLTVEGEPHRALTDARAAMLLLQFMADAEG